MRKIVAVWLCGMLMLSTSLVFLSVDAGEEYVEPAGGGSDLVISNTYIVSGLETWNNITITGTGKLIVPIGATFNVTNIFLQSNSIVEITGGEANLSSLNYAANVMLNGTCSYFNVTNGGIIYMKGSDGSSSLSSSQGGNANIDIIATQGMKIIDSYLTLAGGSGYGPSSPWTTGNLNGYVSAGGSSNITLNLIKSGAIFYVNNTSFNLLGGDGGDAPDGTLSSGNTKGEGGGYTNAGDVSEFVGSGGHASIEFLSLSDIYIKQDTVYLTGGNGGNAGDALNMPYGAQAGSGGGGYSGGDGSPGLSGADGQNGGNIIGHVGAGGSVSASVNSSNVFMEDVIINTMTGNGGNAGKGGTTDAAAGAGGGGYSGGGGGSYTTSSDGGNGGSVSDFVGSGGDSEITFGGSSEASIRNISIDSNGGNAGNAGNGGSSTHRGGAGGGGYSGGGGGGPGPAGSYPLIHAGNGGNGGLASGSVANGGGSKITLYSQRLILLDSLLKTSGGDGKSSGVCGTQSQSWCGGGGGGGYSSGGGGGDRFNGGNSGVGGTSSVSSSVGDGGQALISTSSPLPSISSTTSYIENTGMGGNGFDSSATAPKGGEGLGRTTNPGAVTETIPMSIPLLLSPSNNSFTESTPSFEWLELHDSTTNGPLVDYTIQIDNNYDFSSPEASSTTTDVNYTSLYLTGGTYYWRVKAEYSSPPGSSAGWSDVWVFNIKTLSVLLIDADTYASTLLDFYIRPLQNCSANVTVWDVYGNNGPPQGKSTASDMDPYDVVIWVPDIEMAWTGEPFNNADEVEVANYLSNGGNFFLSNILYTDYTDGSSYAYSPGDFCYDYLGLLGVNGWSFNEYSVNATVGDAVFDGIGPCIQDWTVEPWWLYGFPPGMSDDVVQGLGTTCFFNNDGVGTQAPAAIRYDGGHFRTVFFGFPFETLSSADANEIMNRTLAWFSSTPAIPTMSISKNAPINASPGETIMYTITYQNTGNSTAYNVQIIETYPAQVTFLDSNPVPTIGNNIWYLGDIPPGQSGTIFINVSVNPAASGVLNNTVSLDYENSAGNPQPTESDFALTLIGSPNCVITKWAPATANPGELITYWLNYSNIGTMMAYNVTITELYPADVTFISSFPIPDVGNNVWLIGDVAPGASGSIEITVSVNTNVLIGTALVNTAILDYMSGGGIPFQTSDSATTVVNGPLMNISKWAPAYIDPNGVLITYLITITNFGTDPAYNLMMTETYPVNVSFVSAIPPPDVPTDNVWTIPSIPPGAPITIEVTVQVDPMPSGTLMNFVQMDYENSAGFNYPPVNDTAYTVIIAGDIPFRINSNADFDAAHGVTAGNGTALDPWIIENYDINGTGRGNCIYVGNTTEYFVIRNCILHEANGYGFSTWPFYADIGLILYNATNGIVENNSAFDNTYRGIYLYSNSTYNIVRNNQVYGNGQSGIHLSTLSHRNQVYDNNVSFNGEWGLIIFYSEHNLLSHNTITDNNFGIYITLSDNNTISYNTCNENGWTGLWITESDHNTISYNTFSRNVLYQGIGLEYSNFNNIHNNSCFENNNNGIYMSDSDDNRIQNNDCSLNINYHGISVDISCENNLIASNYLRANHLSGMYVFLSNMNTIVSNTIIENTYGIELFSSSDNMVYHNNIINNSIQAYDDTGMNYWDNGYPSGGNYWSDYSGLDIFSGPLQDIPGSDGIGDTPYFFDFTQDNYPLMTPVNTPDVLAPEHSNEFPANMGTGDQSTEISVHVTDNVALNVSSIHLYVLGFPVMYDLAPITGGYNVSYSHPVDYPEGPVFVRIYAKDTSDNVLDFTWTFYVDLTPPEAWDIDPSPGGITEDTTTTISLNVTDITSGVVISTMRLYVQSFPVLYDYYPISDGYHLYYTHLAGFAPGELVQCRILAEDNNGNWLDYSWNFTITDYLTVQIPVQVGWNLISFPLIPDNTSLPVVLLDLDGDTTWENVQWYDPLDTADHWKTYATFKPPVLNDLTDVTRSMGVWLHIADASALGDGIINVTGLESGSTSIPLYTGWNLVGYPSFVSRAVQDALAGTGYDGIEGFNASAPYLLSPLDNTYMMKTFEGYWIHVPADTTWIIDW